MATHSKQSVIKGYNIIYEWLFKLEIVCLVKYLTDSFWTNFNDDNVNLNSSVNTNDYFYLATLKTFNFHF